MGVIMRGVVHSACGKGGGGGYDMGYEYAYLGRGVVVSLHHPTLMRLHRCCLEGGGGGGGEMKGEIGVKGG